MTQTTTRPRPFVITLIQFGVIVCCFLWVSGSALARGGTVGDSRLGCAPGWSSSGSFAGGVAIPRSEDGVTVRASIEWTPENGANPLLVIGGEFRGVANVLTDNIAVWDGNTWTALGEGLAGPVHSLAVMDGPNGQVLYAGGRELLGEQATSVAQWTGTEWIPVAPIDGVIYALEVFDEGNGQTLFAGTNSHPTVSIIVARLTESGWQGLPALDAPHNVTPIAYALETYDDGSGPALYVGGTFSDSGKHRVARWNGTTWSALGSGTNGPVRSLQAYDDGESSRLIVGGEFTTAGGINSQHLSAWDGANWSSVDIDISGRVLALHAVEEAGSNALYVGGDFQTGGGVFSANLVRWDGTQATSVGLGLDHFVKTVIGYSPDGSAPDLYAGGDFSVAGFVQPANRIARWDGIQWSALEDGLTGGGGLTGQYSDVNRVVYFHHNGEDQLIAAGKFKATSDPGVSNIGRLNNGQWEPLGTGTTGAVEDMILSENGDRIFIAGTFGLAGGQSVGRIASWDGNAWSGFGSGMNADVSAIATYHDGQHDIVFAAGDFTTAGGSPIENIAMWDGSMWHPVGGGIDGHIRALEVVYESGQPILYASGFFGSAGGDTLIRNLARWDGQNWSAVAESATFGDSYCMAVEYHESGFALYIATRVPSPWGGGNNPAFRVRKWDGSQWTSVGQILSGYALAMHMFDDGSCERLFIGGSFEQTVDAQPLNYCALWNGSAWAPLDGGTDGWVYGMTTREVDGADELVIAGDFVSAGGEMAYHIAVWSGCEPSPLCSADVDQDGAIGLGDLNTVLANFGQPSAAGDTNGDGTVNLADLNNVLCSFGTDCPN